MQESRRTKQPLIFTANWIMTLTIIARICPQRGSMALLYGIQFFEKCCLAVKSFEAEKAQATVESARSRCRSGGAGGSPHGDCNALGSILPRTAASAGGRRDCCGFTIAWRCAGFPEAACDSTGATTPPVPFPWGSNPSTRFIEHGSPGERLPSFSSRQMWADELLVVLLSLRADGESHRD